MLNRMKAVVITEPGGPEVLRLRDLPDPQPRPEEVLVRVRATAVNRADLLQRRGRYPAPRDAPADIPGLEFAGEVSRCGARVRGLRPGARVMGIVGGGGYAEQICVHERLCLPVPERLAWEAAAAIPEAFLTAFDALERQARLSRGDSVLLHAAGSGVGTAAAQLALAAEANAIGLSRTAEKRRRLRDLGLRHVLDPAADGLADAILRAAGGEGVDLVLDLIGAAAWPLNLDVLKPRGRIVVVGLLGGTRAELDLGLLLRKRLTIVGTVLRSRSLAEKIELTAEFAERAGDLLADGTLRATIDRTFPLDRVAEAHALMERNATFGKLVLIVDGA
jgi:putative PIG3 family NAD(P)H quinone oxidoreductase